MGIDFAIGLPCRREQTALGVILTINIAYVIETCECDELFEKQKNNDGIFLLNRVYDFTNSSIDDVKPLIWEKRPMYIQRNIENW